jgi:histone H2B
MPPKAAEKKPSTGGKAPAGKAPAEKKEAGKKTATAASGEKKKRGKTRKETYSSYIYKGEFLVYRAKEKKRVRFPITNSY